jgi:hypothetical protein
MDRFKQALEVFELHDIGFEGDYLLGETSKQREIHI